MPELSFSASLRFSAAFAHNVTELALCRFVAGLGQGAVFPVPYLLLSEFVNKQWRGTAVGLANSLLGFSYGLNTLAGALVVGRMPASEAWWVLLMLGGIPIVIVPIIVKYLPESPRFLLKVGKADTVRAFVEDLENRSQVPHDERLIDEGSLKVLEATAQRRVSIFDLFRYPYLQRCTVAYLALLSPFIVFYVITIYGPSILQRMGAGKEDALYYTSGLLFWTVITTAIAGALGDKISRRWGLVIIMTVTAAGTIALGQPLSQAGTIVAAIVVWGFRLCGIPAGKALHGRAISDAAARDRIDAGREHHAVSGRRRSGLSVPDHERRHGLVDALSHSRGTHGHLYSADLVYRLPNLRRQRGADRHRSVGARQDGIAELRG